MNQDSAAAHHFAAYHSSGAKRWQKGWLPVHRRQHPGIPTRQRYVLDSDAKLGGRTRGAQYIEGFAEIGGIAGRRIPTR
jgi:hypothetical protein